MDYTLAQYKPETFEALAHQQTVGGAADGLRLVWAAGAKLVGCRWLVGGWGCVWFMRRLQMAHQ